MKERKYFFLLLILFFNLSSNKVLKKSKIKQSQQQKNQQTPLDQVEDPLKVTQDSEKLSEAAITRLIDRLEAIESTSCKVTAKWILLTLAGVEEKDDLDTLTLSGNREDDLKNMRNLLDDNYLLQVEIKPNHHFILFKKNKEQLYLLQGFQDIFTVKQWMANRKVMEPVYTFDKFFSDFDKMLDPDTPIGEVMELLAEVFLPSFFTNRVDYQKKFINWFLYRMPVELVNVNYVKYNFSENQNDKDFLEKWRYVDSHFMVFNQKKTKTNNKKK